MEFQLTTRNLTGELKWTTDFNISTNKNEVTDMAGSPAIFTGSLDKKISGNVSIIQKGQALGSFYGFQAAGVNPQNGRMMYEKANGMLVYEEDLSADEDRRILGCAQPKFLYGINNVFSYKILTCLSSFRVHTGMIFIMPPVCLPKECLTPATSPTVS